MILPIWHEVDRATVLAHCPSLIGKVAVSTDRGVECIADRLAERSRGAARSVGVRRGGAPAR